MNYEQFISEHRVLYDAFARTVAAILQAAVDTHPREFRLQQIQSRAKDPASLRRKLTERGLLESDKIEQELKDLAGCRLIFYTNTDVDRFLNSALIADNFVIDFDGSKIHRAVGTERTADQLYFAIHYLVSLTLQRLALPEYSRFQGLRCEVQIQTILDHAWAETTHDVIYHKQPLEGFGTRQFEEIKKRTATIMNKYLLPAGYELQKAQHDFERLMQGKELFDRGALEALDAAENNNERYDYLHQIKDNLLPFYDDVPAMAPELIRVASGAIKKGRTAATVPIETPFGAFDGHSFDHVVDAALGIIDQVRYVDIEATFRTLCDLFATAESDEERRRTLQSVETLAQNDVQVWRQVGFAVQRVLFDAIMEFGVDERAPLRPVALMVCRYALSAEITGTSWSFRAVTLQSGAIRPTEAQAEFRKKVLALLFEMYRAARSLGEKREIIQTLDEATRLPMSAGRSDALSEVILDDARAIVEFFAELVESEAPEIVQHLEHQFLWLYRHSKGMVGFDPTSNVRERAEALVVAIVEYRDRANRSERFLRFKTLVGFESVFPPDWEDDGMDVEGQAAYRAARITEYVESISASNADEWYGIVETCAFIKSNDGAMFPSFREFLRKLSARSPAIALVYLAKNEELLSPFLPGILEGLVQGEGRADARALMSQWVDEGRHLAEIARHIRLATDPDLELLKRLTGKALAVKESMAIIESIAVVVEKQAMSLVDDVLLPGVRYLTSIGDTRWIDATWFVSSFRPLLQGFSEDQCTVLLENLVLRPSVDNHTDAALRAIASAHPRKVWLFFGDRIARERNKARGDQYRAVPFQLRELRETLAQHPDVAIDTARAWFTQDPRLFKYRGGKLLHNVFPMLGGDFEVQLVRLTRNGDPNDIVFVLSVLRSYQEGGTSVHNVCKELIERLSEDDDRLADVQIALQSTGVIAGQFGLVEAYQRKKQEVESWLSDPREKVRKFAEKYRRSLDRSIASEQRRSEADYELGRREWGDEDDASGTSGSDDGDSD